MNIVTPKYYAVQIGEDIEQSEKELRELLKTSEWYAEAEYGPRFGDPYIALSKGEPYVSSSKHQFETAYAKDFVIYYPFKDKVYVLSQEQFVRQFRI